MFKLTPLPYEYAALKPVLSAETLEFHHDKHHRFYLEKLNELVEERGLETTSLEDLIRHSKGAVFNNAAQVWNHEFYWHSLSPVGTPAPHGVLATALNAKFGSLSAFKERFNSLAAAHFGAGWAWLVMTTVGELDVVTTHDADTPLRREQVPLLTCDVWEHAYYIDYRNERAKYLDGFWDIVDWKEIGRRYAETTARFTPGERRRSDA